MLPAVSDFSFVKRDRAYTDPKERFIFEVDWYRDGDVCHGLCHFRFFKFSKSALKSALMRWRELRTFFVKAPLWCHAGEDDSEKWHRFIRMFGFRPTGQFILCNNGERRELFVHTVEKNNDGIDRNQNEPDHQSAD